MPHSSRSPRAVWFLLAAMGPLLPAVAQTNTQLLRDINTVGVGTANPGSDFEPLGETPGNPPTLWARATTLTRGCELYRIDGVTGVAVLVADANPGPRSSFPGLLCPGPVPVFELEEPSRGRELWTIDSNGVLQPLPEAVPGTLGAHFSTQVSMGGACYVVRVTETSPPQIDLLRIANASVSTIAALTPPVHPGGVTPLLSADSSGRLQIGLLALHSPTGNAERWVSDCTAAGTRRVPETWAHLSYGPPGSDLFAGDRGDAVGYELYGFTANGSTLVADIHPAGGSFPRELTRLGNLSYFTADDGARGRELWRTDGTVAGTALVMDLFPGIASAEPRHLTSFNGGLLFEANDGTSGAEPHFLTPTGPIVRLGDLSPGISGTEMSKPHVAGVQALFAANDGVHGQELWRTDGTPAGTRLVSDYLPGSAGSSPRSLYTFAGRVFLAADDGTGHEPTRYDTATTILVRLADLQPQVPRTLGSDPTQFFEAGWDTIFSARGNSGGNEPHRMTFNGDGGGATRIKDIALGSSSSNPSGFVSLPDLRVVFAATGAGGRELWVSDGSDAGTQRVKDIRPGSVGSEPSGFVWVSGLRAVVFTADDGVHGSEMWCTDGTEGGTRMLVDLQPGSVGSGPALYTMRRDGTLFFRADDGQSGAELWALDHGSTTPRLVADLQNPGPSFPTGLALVDLGNGQERLYFDATTTQHGPSLYTTDGTAAGTVHLRAFRTVWHGVGFVDGKLYFAAEDNAHGPELWRSDGTPAGTVLFADLAPGPLGSLPADLTVALGTDLASASELYFSAIVPGLGRELCVLRPIVNSVETFDLNPGPASSDPRELRAHHAALPQLAFAADGGLGTGHEPWTSLGTRDSTHRVRDLNAAAGVGSDPEGFTVTAYGWLFSGDDGVRGREVWTLDLGAGGHARAIGPPCGDDQPTLSTTAPRLGRTMTMSGSRTPPGNLSALLLGVPVRGMRPVIFGCGLTVDPFTSILLPLGSLPRDWTVPLAIPNRPELAGLELDFRVVSASLAGPQPNLTNGMRTRTGR